MKSMWAVISKWASGCHACCLLHALPRTNLDLNQTLEFTAVGKHVIETLWLCCCVWGRKPPTIFRPHCSDIFQSSCATWNTLPLLRHCCTLISMIKTLFEKKRKAFCNNRCSHSLFSVISKSYKTYFTDTLSVYTLKGAPLLFSLQWACRKATIPLVL